MLLMTHYDTMVYRVEVSAQDKTGRWDVIDSEDLLYLRDGVWDTPPFDELISWYTGDLVECKVEVYEMRWCTFQGNVHKSGRLEVEFMDGDCATGLNGSPIDWREYDGDGVTGEDQEE